MSKKKKDPGAVRLGRKGGRAGKGAAKARSREQAQKAARARWRKEVRPANPTARLELGHIFANPNLDQAQELMDELPLRAVDHLIKAFVLHTGLGGHPGEYRGPEIKDPFNQTKDTRCVKS
jgi:hypothetical protein